MKLIKSYGTSLLLLALLLSGGQRALAQIYSATADISKDITYNSGLTQDQLFVFYQSDGSKPGELSVNSPADSADFVWRKYDPSSSSFSILELNDPGQTSSTIDSLAEGGYQVSITNSGGLDTTFVAWLMLDNFTVSITKTAGNIPPNNSNCSNGNNLLLDAKIVADTFNYYDPITHAKIPYVNNYDFEWTSDNSEIEIYNRTRFLYLDNQVVPVPVEDTYFILTATDSLNMMVIDSALFDTKFTRAEFTVEYYDKVNEVWNADLTENWSLETGSLDAPLKVRFSNESINGSEYTWVFLDTFNVIENERYRILLDTFDIEYQPEFTYYTADKYYYPYLVSISDAACKDTFRLNDGIRVVPSELLVPNVFSPNGDEINDVFLFKHQSLKEFKLTIINKFGKVVYRQEVEDIYQWEGWRGTILNSDRPAPEGQYYYIVEGLGYDNVEFQDPNVFEQWKIDRQQGGSNPGTSSPGTSGTDPQSISTNIYTGWLYLYRNSGEY